MAKKNVKKAAKKSKKKKPQAQDTKAVVLLITGILGALSLYSFKFLEPSQNFLGFVGYVVALGSVYLFGLASYLLPAYLLWLGVKSLTKKTNPYSGYDHLYFSIFLVSCSLLLTVYADSFP